jgi:hypothetical protein
VQTVLQLDLKPHAKLLHVEAAPINTELFTNGVGGVGREILVA